MVQWRPIIFTATVISAIVLISLLIVHKSSSRICKSSGDLLYLSDPKNHNETVNDTCYPLNSQGPCPDNMILIQDVANKSLGVCDCDNVNNQRTFIYNEENNKCYSIFTQAYCRRGQWLRYTKEGSICEKNTCLALGLPEDWVPLSNGNCWELGKHHHACENPDQVIQFFRNKLYPACTYSPEVPPRINVGNVGVPPAECPENHSRTRLGHCALDFDFD